MSVFLNNIDDYLGPSQACVNPLFTAPSKSSSADTTLSASLDNAKSQTDDSGNNDSSGAVHNKRRIRWRPPPRIIQNEEDANTRREPIRLLHNTDDGFAASETNTVNNGTSFTKKKAKATVTLSDCLSCSGCVTSAEAVLLSHHSVDKFREMAQQSTTEKKQIVFTISTAALADLYRHVYFASEVKSNLDDTNISDGDDIEFPYPSRHEFLQQITTFLHTEFGVAAVVDGAATQRISLLESAHEFCYRYRQHQLQDTRKVSMVETGCDVTSVSLSSTQTRYIKKKSNVDESDGNDTMEVTVVDHPPGLILQNDKDCTSVGDSIRNVHNQSLALPMLASSCPGFVCLVEKTAASVVPLLSSAKSPMSVAGTLLKSGMLSDTSQCFHVAVMPCHDKKLEAGRNDFVWERQTLLKYANGASATTVDGSEFNEIVNEVDLVLTTGELLEIFTSTAEKSSGSQSSSSIRELMELHKTHSKSDSTESPCLLVTDMENYLICSPKHGASCEQSSNVLELDVGVHGSGSYSDFIFRYASLELFGCKLSHNVPLPWANPLQAANNTTDPSSGVIRRRRRRQDTADLRSITLYRHNDGSYSCTGSEGSTPVLSFATAYGFKNVQLILQSLTKNGAAGTLDAKEYDYVEVMACPSGCPNGGGQIGAMGQRETPRDTKERVKRTMACIPLIAPDGCGETVASSLYRFNDHDGTDNTSHLLNFALNDGCFGKSARRLLHTRFHIVPKLELTTGATAGVAVSDTKW
jgi:iron only hydrogenase large subunit-like protein